MKQRGVVLSTGGKIRYGYLQEVKRPLQQRFERQVLTERDKVAFIIDLLLRAQQNQAVELCAVVGTPGGQSDQQYGTAMTRGPVESVHILAELM